MLGPHADQIAAALAGHHAEPHHADQVRPRVRSNMIDHPGRPRHMPAVGDVEVFHLVEGIDFGEVEGDGPIPDRAPDRQHLVCHHRRFLHRVARSLGCERRQVC